MKRQKRFTLKEKKRISRLLKQDLIYLSNQEILELIEGHEDKQTKLFETGVR